MFRSNFRPNSRMENCLREQEFTPREREVIRMVSDCVQPGLICPDDEGVIRSVAQSGLLTFAVGGLGVGDSNTQTIAAIGMMHCLMIGLENSNLTTETYQLTIVRSGLTVYTGVRANFQGSTANARALMPCAVCVGAIQSVSVTVTNTGAAFPATAVLSFAIGRDFDNPNGCSVIPQVCGKGGC